MAINTNALPDYVEQHRLPLIAKSILGAKSAKLFTKQTGVKSESALNLLDTTVVFGDGSDCGWNEAGETKLSQRTLKPAQLKVNMSFCDKKLLGKWTSYDVQVASLPEDKRLPFEENFTNGVVDGVVEGVEKMIWQGDSDNGNEFDGLLKILGNTEDVITVDDFEKGTPYYEAIKAVYLAMPEAIATKSDAVIFVSDGAFRGFIQELVEANLYHYDANDGEGEYKLPGTNCRVIAVSGLNGVEATDPIVAGRLSNMFYGTDLEGDEEKFDLWYSKDNREHRLAIEFVGATQVAYPDEIVIGAINKA